MLCGFVAIISNALSAAPPFTTVTTCFGRFCADIPEDWEVLRVAHEIRFVRVTELDYSANETFETHWQQHQASLQQFGAESETPKLLDTRDFPRNSRGALHHRYEFPGIFTWDVLMPQDGYAVLFSIDFDAEHKDYAEGLLLDVLNAYENARTHDGEPGFYLMRGRVALPFKYSERAEITYRSRDGKVELTVNLRTSTKKEAGLLARLGRSLVPFTVMVPAGTKTHRYWRTVANMWGDEVHMEDSAQGQRYFTWHYDGRRKSAGYPRTDIDMQVHDTDLHDKVPHEQWSYFLDSFRHMEKDIQP